MGPVSPSHCHVKTSAARVDDDDPGIEVVGAHASRYGPVDFAGLSYRMACPIWSRSDTVKSASRTSDSPFDAVLLAIARTRRSRSAHGAAQSGLEIEKLREHIACSSGVRPRPWRSPVKRQAARRWRREAHGVGCFRVSVEETDDGLGVTTSIASSSLISFE